MRYRAHTWLTGAAVILGLVVAGAPAAAQRLVQTPAEARDIGPTDLWIVSLGDSFSSGEGNPHNIGGVSAPINQWRWLDNERCHRSEHAWPYLLWRSLRGTLANFTFLACSGAQLEEGLLKSQTIDRPGERRTVRPPQLERLERMIRAARRPPDIVLMTGGGNDIGFADLVMECVFPGNCPGGEATTLLAARMAELPDRYAAVAARLSGRRTGPIVAGPDLRDIRDGRAIELVDPRRVRDPDAGLGGMRIPPDRIILVMYPNPLKGMRGNRYEIRSECQPGVAEQWAWASAHVVEPLQDIQRRVARQHGWTLIDGHLEDFKHHSYCPRGDSWWVGITETLLRQWGLFGAFHPIGEGHRSMARAAGAPEAVVAADFPTYGGGGGTEDTDPLVGQTVQKATEEEATPPDDAADAPGLCCRIESMDRRSGLVTARRPDGETFRFRVRHAALLRSLQPGQGFDMSPALERLRPDGIFSIRVPAVQRAGRPDPGARDPRAGFRTARNCCRLEASRAPRQRAETRPQGATAEKDAPADLDLDVPEVEPVPPRTSTAGTIRGLRAGGDVARDPGTYTDEEVLRTLEGAFYIRASNEAGTRIVTFYAPEPAFTRGDGIRFRTDVTYFEQRGPEGISFTGRARLVGTFHRPAERPYLACVEGLQVANMDLEGVNIILEEQYFIPEADALLRGAPGSVTAVGVGWRPGDGFRPEVAQLEDPVGQERARRSSPGFCEDLRQPRPPRSPFTEQEGGGTRRHDTDVTRHPK